MKTLALLLFFAFGILLQAQSQHITTDRVPGAVGKAFRAKFPDASQDSWSMAGQNTYEVVFFNSHKKQSAVFKETGEWLLTETEIDISKVPSAVMKHLYKDYSGYNVQEADLQEKPDGTFYLLTVNKESEGYELKYSAKGELLEKNKAVAEDQN